MTKLFCLVFVAFNLMVNAQNSVQPWEEVYQFEALVDQADGASVSIDITNQGSDIEDCKKKAKAQALFTIIFKGYPKTNRASASIALTDMANYNQNIDFYKDYLLSNVGGQAHINKCETNTSKPGSKIDKKTIKSTTTVYIMKGKLREDLQAQGKIKSASAMAKSLGITPTILIVPSEMWMRNAKFATKETTDIGEVWFYDYQSAINDPKMVLFVSIEGFLKPTLQASGFRVVTLTEIMDQLNKANFANRNRTDKAYEDPLDILAKTAQANIWLKVNLVQEDLSSQEKQYQLTLNGIDPLLMQSVINGLPQTIKSAENNVLRQLETTVNASIDNLIPQISSFFEKREKEGIPGIVEFQISEELSQQLTFNDYVNIGGEEYPFTEVIDAMVGTHSIQKETRGETTGALRAYDVIIPSKSENALNGKVEANNYEKFTRKVNSDLRKKMEGLNLTPVVENKGLGKVVVIFKPKS